ncbi:MAG TPA: calcium-binding protein, partial [Vicinamibacteria bacterium]|nr:calcium-binding protein [Vicinamibacteria bacterium]
ANGVEPADEFTSVSFWPQLDLIGADVYTPLTGKTNPTRAELVAGWRHNRDGHDMVATFHNLQQAYGKPLVFTEIGYRSGDGANSAPWDWGASLPADPGEQADCYEAMYEVWSQEASWMKGPFWWAWDVSPPAAGDTGYNPRGKPAEDVLRGWQK